MALARFCAPDLSSRGCCLYFAHDLLGLMLTLELSALGARLVRFGSACLSRYLIIIKTAEYILHLKINAAVACDHVDFIIHSICMIR